MPRKTCLVALVAILAAPAVQAETKAFLGVDTVDTETKITYANGDETYNFTNLRVRYGFEDDAGGSAGIELISGDSDEIIDPFGQPFELATDIGIGFYATLGKPVYLRLGWSTWQSEYTDVTRDLTDTYTTKSYEIGVGINLLLNRNFTFYGEYSLKDTESKYPKHVAGSGMVDYESELISVGFNYLF